MRRAAMAVILSLAGCASSSSQPGHVDPEIQLVQLSNVADAARNVTGNIPVQYRLEIHNTTPAPLTLKRIDLVSLGEGAYNLQPVSQAYDKAIGAGESAALDLWSSANIQSATISGANGPVTIRAIVQFDSKDGRFQTVVVQQVHPNGSV
jgi:hypothetical protein